MEFDIFIPSLSLAFEYNGRQHYEFNNLFGSSYLQQKRDRFKLASVKLTGITLITIPYWWDEKEASLLSTIQAHRPDIQLQDQVTSSPIALTIPARLEPVIQPKVPTVFIDIYQDPAKWWIMPLKL